jgi:hypothetical protein
MKNSRAAHPFVMFAMVSLGLRGFFIFLFPQCFSFDVGSWIKVANVLMAGGNPYNETAFLNYPPLLRIPTHFGQ